MNPLFTLLTIIAILNLHFLPVIAANAASSFKFNQIRSSRGLYSYLASGRTRSVMELFLLDSFCCFP